MDSKNLGKGLVCGGSIGVLLSIIAEVFLFKNRLRTVETSAFTIVGSNEVNTTTVGIENWIGLSILALFFMALCFFIISAGFRLLNDSE